MAFFGKQQPIQHRRLGLMGGTFDPIHLGHLLTADNAAYALSLNSITLLPCGIHPHGKIYNSSDAQRLDMLNLAVKDFPRLNIDTRELYSSEISYTVNTLISLRKEHDNATELFFIMGEDAFLSLPRWHKWQSLIELAHLVVVLRPSENKASNNVEAPVLSDGKSPSLESSALRTTINTCKTLNESERQHLLSLVNSHCAASLKTKQPLKTKQQAHQLFALALSPRMISSTMLRQGIARYGVAWAKPWLTPEVFRYIQNNKLYA